MNPKCIYTVKTHWGWFHLDEGAYEDYLKGRLWITWVPGQREAEELLPAETKPVHVSDEALSLYGKAEKLGAWPLVQTRFGGKAITVPYKPRMSEIEISEMNLTVRASNGLMRAGAKNLGRLAELIQLPLGLKSVRNLGIKSEKDIMQGFFELCYSKLNRRERMEFWQTTLSERENTPDPHNMLYY